MNNHNQPLLEICGLTSHYGRIQALHGIDIDVRQGQLVALVGANGAGKTTLLRAISGVQPVSGGAISLAGADITRASADKRVRAGICQVPEGRQVFGPMTIEDNLKLGAFTRPKAETAEQMERVEPHEIARRGLVHVPQGRMIIPGLTVEENLRIGANRVPDLKPAEIDRMLEQEYQRFPVLKSRRAVLGTSLSGGEQQMLAVSRALMMKPKLIMLDEPSLGLAPQIVSAIFQALRGLAASGTTVLLVEQAAITALKLADFGYVLQSGGVVLSGSSSSLLADSKLVERYLG